MKFAIISDIHLGPGASYNGKIREITENAVLFVNDFIDRMNNDVKPAFVVVLGDLINETNYNEDVRNISLLVDLFKKLECPVHFVAGNHDLKKVSENELVSLFNYKKLFYSFDSGNFHCIVLFSRRNRDKDNITVFDEQLDWLKNELNIDKKCIVFLHHSLADQDLRGNPWFEGKPDFCLVANRKDVRNVLEARNNVVAVFNGHLHWDRMHVHNGIPHFTVQSLIENEDDKGVPSRAYTIVDIDKTKVVVQIKGNYPKKFEYSF